MAAMEEVAVHGSNKQPRRFYEIDPLGNRVRAAVEQQLFLHMWQQQSIRVQMALRRRCDLRWESASAFCILYEAWFLLRAPQRMAVLWDISLLDLEFCSAMAALRFSFPTGIVLGIILCSLPRHLLPWLCSIDPQVFVRANLRPPDVIQCPCHVHQGAVILMVACRCLSCLPRRLFRHFPKAQPAPGCPSNPAAKGNMARENGEPVGTRGGAGSGSDESDFQVASSGSGSVHGLVQWQHEEMNLSSRLSQAVAQVWGEAGRSTRMALTIVEPGAEAAQQLSIRISRMRPDEAFHPWTVVLADDAEDLELIESEAPLGGRLSPAEARTVADVLRADGVLAALDAMSDSEGATTTCGPDRSADRLSTISAASTAPPDPGLLSGLAGSATTGSATTAPTLTATVVMTHGEPSTMMHSTATPKPKSKRKATANRKRGPQSLRSMICRVRIGFLTLSVPCGLDLTFPPALLTPGAAGTPWLDLLQQLPLVIRSVTLDAEATSWPKRLTNQPTGRAHAELSRTPSNFRVVQALVHLLVFIAGFYLSTSTYLHGALQLGSMCVFHLRANLARPPARQPAPAHSRLGPKSQSRRYGQWCRALLQVLCLIYLPTLSTATRAADARVGLPTHQGSPGAPSIAHISHEEAKRGDLSHGSSSLHVSSRATPKKRALQRAITRASRNADLHTWYRGRREVLQWLCREDQANRPVDVMCIVETAWREDSEFTTRRDPNLPKAPQWHAVHTGSKEKAGVLCLIRASLLGADDIRYNVLQAGRLLHIRLQLQVPLDILCVYQIAWNPSRASLAPSHKAEQLVQQRDKLWRKMSQWAATIPLRHGFLMLGDFNTPLQQELPYCGPGLASAKDPPQKDRETFQTLLRQVGGRALNTWSTSGCPARTYLPPSAGADTLGTQIDYIIVRDNMCDQEARRTRPTDARFIPHSGCRHLLVSGTIPAPLLPKGKPGRPTRVIPNKAQRMLADPDQVATLWRETSHLQEEGQHDPLLDLDAALAHSWTQLARAKATPTPEATSTALATLAADEMATTHLVRQLWLIRDRLKQQARYVAQAQPEVFLVNMWHGWRQVSLLQKTQRELRRRGRQRKVAQVAAAVEADNVYQAAKQFAPKARRRRLQLRTKSGAVQTHEEEFRDILAYFRKLYGGPTPSPDYLSEALHFMPEEIHRAIRRLAPGKAMPSSSAPAAVWKALQLRLVPLVTQQFNHVCQPGTLILPRAWCISELVLLPKPGKALTSVDQLRPICLLAPMAKLLAATLADRLRPHASSYLTDISQFAYLPHRSLQQALERVASHCSEVKALLASHSRNPYAGTQTIKHHQVEGGIMLSLDISKAYDCVSRQMLHSALSDAGVPQALTDVILAVHNQACIRVSHHQCQQDAPLHTGLRQGCGLSPVLWALVSGWLLKQLPGMDFAEKARSTTVYADDFLFKWIIKSGRALEEAYRKIRQVLAHLRANGLEVSTAKTVILVELRGPKAHQALRKYTVQIKDALYMRFQIEGKHVDLRIVQQHVYLGAVIGYRRMGPDTLKHRVALATGQFSRLRPILRCKAVPQALRLRLWHACLPACLLHGLDCTGLTPTEAAHVCSMITQQARTVAQSHSMWTHETNRDFTQRLQIVRPLERLHQAILHRQRLDPTLGPLLQPSEAQLQWRAVLLSQVQLAEPSFSELGPARVIPVDQVVAEVFACPECGQQFSSQATMKRHVYLQHLAAEAKQDRQHEVKQHARTSHMEHAKNGLPWCKHCDKQFQNWPNFHYHINSQSCPTLRQIYSSAQPGDTLATLSEALIGNSTIVDLAGHGSWLDLAAHEEVRRCLHHCVECFHRSIRPQYVKRHMLAKHPELKPQIDQCALSVLAGSVAKFSVAETHISDRVSPSSTEPSCSPGLLEVGHLANLIMTLPPLLEAAMVPETDQQRLKEATGELRMMESLAPKGSVGLPSVLSQGAPQEPRDASMGNDLQEDGEPKLDSDRPQKWQRQSNKGSGDLGKGPSQRPPQRTSRQPSSKGNGKGKQRQAPWRQDQAQEEWYEEETWSTNHRETQYLQYLRSRVDLLTTLLLRHDNQLSILRLDSSYMVFIRTDMEGNLAKALYDTGVAWKETKEKSPEKLESPMRVVLCQALLTAVASRFEQLMNTEASKATAISLGWITADATKLNRMKWDYEAKKHVIDTEGTQIEIKKALGMVMELVILCKEPLVVNRFHATRPMTKEVESATLPMLLDFGMRTPSANKAWGLLRDLCGPLTSTTGFDAGKVHLGQQVLNLRLGNEHNYCYGNAVLRGLLRLSYDNGGLAGFFPPLLQTILNGALHHRGVYHIWKNPFWRAIMKGWQRPTAQHDAAEFLQHLVGQCPSLADVIGLTWASVEGDSSEEHRDGGCFAPLLLHPPADSAQLERAGTTVQQLVDLWHRQDCIHAALTGPPNLVLQANRFVYDAQSGVSQKQHYCIGLDRSIRLPVYAQGGDFGHVIYDLCAVAYHLGESTVCGHYKTLVLLNNDSYIADDNQAAQRANTADLEECGKNAYLFFYTRSP
ncbi:Pol [Symbiodinium sp. CCMP2592]|nr:Pol [Symbiodinium sp. CCMP2592]